MTLIKSEITKKGKKNNIYQQKRDRNGSKIYFLGEERVKQEWKEGREDNTNKRHYIQV